MTDLPIQKTRSLKEVLLAALQYMLSNARSLLFAIVLFSLPLVLAARLISYLGTGYGEAFNRFFIYRSTYEKNIFVSLAVAYLLNLAGICLFSLTVNRNVLSSNALKNESGHLLPGLKNGLEKDLRDFIISFLIIFAAYTLLSEGLSYFSSMYDNAVNPFSPGEIPILHSFVSFLPYLLVFSIGFYYIISSLFICVRDNAGAVEAIKKVQQTSIHNLSKAWLGSALIMVMVFFANYLLKTAFYGLYAFTGFAFFNTPLIFIINLLQTSLTCLILLYFQLAILFLHGSMEDEVTGNFIRSKIENV